MAETNENKQQIFVLRIILENQDLIRATTTATSLLFAGLKFMDSEDLKFLLNKNNVELNKLELSKYIEPKNEIIDLTEYYESNCDFSIDFKDTENSIIVEYFKYNQTKAIRNALKAVKQHYGE